MYVCLCKGVTDNQIKDAINQGACSMRDLRADLDVATQCGKCARDCKSLLLENMTGNQVAAMASAQYVAA
ncbi:MAG: bacterioferritin-associated ferredoxin [Halopseudomonas sp.]|uniref:bacterioferritin-associated ferredoxin n=1 Tax=Halopseudomonas sp. TaxID=2901191 RepID=UPI0030036D99